MVLHSAQEILTTVQSVKDPKIVITTHYKPDADAMGSSLGLKLFLEALGFHVNVVTPSDYASFLKWMKGNDQTIVFEADPGKAAKSFQGTHHSWQDWFHSAKIEHSPGRAVISGSDEAMTRATGVR